MENPGKDFWECWSCHASIDDQAGVSLNGRTPQLCDACWKKLSVFERMILKTIHREHAEEGCDLPLLCRAWTNLGRAALEGWTLPKQPPDRFSESN